MAAASEHRYAPTKFSVYVLDSFTRVEDDHMNVLGIGGRTIGSSVARDLIETFLTAKFSNAERHLRRSEWLGWKCAKGNSKRAQWGQRGVSYLAVSFLETWYIEFRNITVRIRNCFNKISYCVRISSKFTKDCLEFLKLGDTCFREGPVFR